MRRVIKKGLEVRTLKCPVCGQVEIQTVDEAPDCLNCGSIMDLANAEPTPKEAPKALSRRGRPPKAKEAEKMCKKCSNALVTLGNDYTCKVTMDLMDKDSECAISEKFVPGEPYGDRR